MDDLTVDYTNTHDWNEAEGRCLRCGMTDCGEPCTIDERASHTHAFNRKGLSRSCRICSLGLSADIHRKKGRILPAGNGFADPTPAVDATGRTATEFLAAAFEFEYCCECGRDTADHTAVIGPTGGWFAHCDKPEKNQVYECGICDSIHPWDWSGDCREDTNRFAGVDDYCKRKGISETAVEVMSWEDRQAADENDTKPAYGGPILSPYTSEQIMTGKHGQLQVRALPEADTFGLFYLANELEDRPALTRGWTLLACHPNGHSCKELAQRILSAWEGKGDGARAVDQFDFILRCGGLGRSLETILAVIRGQY